MTLINLKALFAVALFATVAHASQHAKQQKKPVYVEWSKADMKKMLEQFKTDGDKKRQSNRAQTGAKNSVNQIQKTK